MKILLICPSNLLYMPYVSNYTEILDTTTIKYDLIVWDRFGFEEPIDNKIIYRDEKLGHQRGFGDYYQYCKFIKKYLVNSKYKKIIVFGLPIFFFLQNYLKKTYKNRFILDIRDYNRIYSLFINKKKIFSNIKKIIISSKGYTKWLPKSSNIIVNHNTRIDYNQVYNKYEDFENYKKRVVISCIGALRDYEINRDFVKSLENLDEYKLKYHGDGIINKDLKKYIEENKIFNVTITGKYQPCEEDSLYEDSDMINVLRYSKDINNNTALPNRLYKAVLMGKPLIAYEGTYLAEIIEKYNLGIVVNDLKNLDSGIKRYMNTFDRTLYNKSRLKFLEEVYKENNQFLNSLLEFVSGEGDL